MIAVATSDFASLDLGSLLMQAAQVQAVPASSLTPAGWTPAWAFWILSALVVVGAISTISQRSLISAVMSLVATFFGLAGLYATLSAHFLAAIQVLVYAGAIMVLFVFVIMVLNRDEVERVSDRGLLDKAIGAGALVYLAVRLGEVIASPVGPVSRMSKPAPEFGTVAKIGEYFFTEFLFPFEAISILLIIAVIGAVVVARTVVSRPTTSYEVPNAASGSAEGGDDHAGGDAHGAHGGH
ncbi:MAG: NADH-quinone oxidoreductase subunit J [Myxococcales bacterium]|nr:NADH-quinone oxidoreductase subunit J [Myxococcales bacterium]